jgi:hypothetical protein
MTRAVRIESDNSNVAMERRYFLLRRASPASEAFSLGERFDRAIAARL